MEIPCFCAHVYLSRAVRHLLPPHLPQKEAHGGSRCRRCIAEHPADMRQNTGKVAGEQRPLHLHCVDKRQQIRRAPEYAADQFKIEPRTGEPRRQIGQQCPAQPADLLDAENASAGRPSAMKNSDTSKSPARAYRIFREGASPAMTAAR